MKQRLLLAILILFSISICSQNVSGPPPAVGYLGYHICDWDENSIEEFDLSTHFNFPFNIPGEESSNYNVPTFYLTEEDRNNETNPILNPSAYINETNPQRVYYRAYAIAPEAYEYLDGDEIIQAEPVPTPSSLTTLVLCDIYNNGQNTFDLTDENEQILAGMNSSMYIMEYYENMNDALNETNRISNVLSYNNITNPQTLFVNVHHRYASTCYNIVELVLDVKTICKDAAVYLTPFIPPRPGFSYINYLTIRNEGRNSDISGRVEFIIDPSLILNSITDINSGNTLSYTSTGFILGFNSSYEKVKINMHLSHTVPLGTEILNTCLYRWSRNKFRNSPNQTLETIFQ